MKTLAAAYWKPQPNSLLNSLPSLANIRSSSGGYSSTSQYIQPGSAIPSQIGPVLRVGSDSTGVGQDGRVSTSSPLASSGIMHGSPLSDSSSQHSDSGELSRDGTSNGVINFTRPRSLDTALYYKCIMAMYTLAKDPSPRIASLGRRVLSIIGVEQVVTKALRPNTGSVRQGESMSASPGPNFPGLARSSSWLDMNAGNFVVYAFSGLHQALIHILFNYFYNCVVSIYEISINCPLCYSLDGHELEIT